MVEGERPDDDVDDVLPLLYDYTVSPSGANTSVLCVYYTLLLHQLFLAGRRVATIIISVICSGTCSRLFLPPDKVSR